MSNHLPQYPCKVVVTMEQSNSQRNNSGRVFIYFDRDKKSFQTIQPAPEFNKQYRDLVDIVTNSDTAIGYKNYDSFEIIN